MPQEANVPKITRLESSRIDVLGWLTREWRVQDNGEVIFVWHRAHRATEKWDVFNTVTQRDIAPSKSRHKKIVEAVKAHVTYSVLFKDREIRRDVYNNRVEDRTYTAVHDGHEWIVLNSMVTDRVTDTTCVEWEIHDTESIREIEPATDTGRALIAMVEAFEKFRKEQPCRRS